MSFHEVRFPDGLSYNSRGGPGFNTQIIEVDSGAEERIVRWATARRRYNARYAVKKHTDLSALQSFFITVQGAAHGFRYKDWLDFTTAANHQGSVTFSDQSIGTGDGTTTTFQLSKSYSNGVVTRIRNITKPVAGTTKVGVNGVNQTSGWSVNTTTGIITFSVAPSNGAAITAGCEFDVPVRFGAEVDKVLSLTIEDFSSGSIEDIPLVELFDEGQASDEYFYGGAKSISSSSSISISTQDGRAINITMSTSGLSVLLPNVASLPTGGPYFALVNTGADSWTLKTSSGSTIMTVNAGSGITLYLGLNSSAQKVWYAV